MFWTIVSYNPMIPYEIDPLEKMKEKSEERRYVLLVSKERSLSVG